MIGVPPEPLSRGAGGAVRGADLVLGCCNSVCSIAAAASACAVSSGLPCPSQFLRNAAVSVELRCSAKRLGRSVRGTEGSRAERMCGRVLRPGGTTSVELPLHLPSGRWSINMKAGLKSKCAQMNLQKTRSKRQATCMSATSATRRTATLRSLQYLTADCLRLGRKLWICRRG
jgi:hypothetical protein